MHLRIVFIVFCLLAPMAVADPAHCSITIRNKPHRGKDETIRFQSALRSRLECLTLARLHNKNFEPRRYRTKRVSYVWNGPDVPKRRQTAPTKMVTRREKPALHSRRRR